MKKDGKVSKAMLKRIKGNMIMLEDNTFKDVTELADDDKVLMFVMIFDGVTVQYYGIKDDDE